MSYKYVVGIDGGGTRCRALLQDIDGNTLGEGAAGPANIMTCLLYTSDAADE